MDNIIIQESIIYSVTKNINQELIVKIKIKPEDYTQELEDLLYKTKIPLAIVMQPFQSEEPKQPTIWEKRAKLAGLMELYAKKENTDIEIVKQKLYDKYKIKSRTELTEVELDFEIKSFISGLEYEY